MSTSVEEYCNVDADLMANLLTGESKVEDEQSSGEETLKATIDRFDAKNDAFRERMDSPQEGWRAELDQLEAKLTGLHQAIAAQQVMLDELTIRVAQDEAR